MIDNNKNTALFLGLTAALFFAVTFVLNRLMSISGGSWIWSASFRYFFMVPFLLIIVWARKGLLPLMRMIWKDLWKWVGWSTIGFGVFYAPLTFSASYGPSWLVASTWQITIIAGMLVAPFLEKGTGCSRKGMISKKAMLFSLLILVGILLIQIRQASRVSLQDVFFGTVPVMIAAFAYPLGNRKMMMITDGRIDSFQRTLGMTLASLPFWFVLSTVGLFSARLPSAGQLSQTLIVALSSGVIATSVFFMATDKARNNQRLLASVEATQSGEVLFALLGEIIILKGHLPDLLSSIGIALVILGMILHSLKHD